MFPVRMSAKWQVCPRADKLSSPIQAELDLLMHSNLFHLIRSFHFPLACLSFASSKPIAPYPAPSWSLHPYILFPHISLFLPSHLLFNPLCRIREQEASSRCSSPSSPSCPSQQQTPSSSHRNTSSPTPPLPPPKNQHTGFLHPTNLQF